MMSVMSIDSNEAMSPKNSADPRGRGPPEQQRASPSDEEELNAESKETAFIIDCHFCISKMPTVRNARSLVTSRELLSGLQISGKSPVECIVLCGYNER